DQNNFRIDGGLSYAANVGYVDSGHWGGTETSSVHVAGTIAFDVTTEDSSGNTLQAAVIQQARRNVHQSTGLFWRQSNAPRMTADFISRGDGLSQTLMLAENIQSRNWASAIETMNDTGFGISVN